ncbi:aminotransferase class IV family protein [Bacteroidota bacterium]
MFPLLETIKIIGRQPLNLQWHQRRLDYAFHILFGTNNPMQLNELIQVPDTFGEGLLKCRFLYGSTDFKIEYSEHSPRQVSSLKIVQCDTIDYSHKYTNRSMLTGLLEQKGEADDILIVRDGWITDTSYSNIVFFDGEAWFTPEEPLLEGTARNRLLAEGKIFPAKIQPENLKNYKSFKLINAMLDFEEQEDMAIMNIY